MARDKTRIKRKERKNIASGVAHVNSTFNNTKILISDVQGNAISHGRLPAPWASKGRGNRHPTLLRWLQKMQARRRRITALKRWKSKFRAPVRAVNRLCARWPQLASTSRRSVT